MVERHLYAGILTGTFFTSLLQACKHGWYAVSHVTAQDLQGFHSTKKDNKDLIAHVTEVMRTMLYHNRVPNLAVYSYLVGIKNSIYS